MRPSLSPVPVKQWTFRAVVAMIGAFVLGLIAWMVGKTTPRVWAARLSENRAAADAAREALRTSIEARSAIREAETASHRATENRALMTAHIAELDAKGRAIAEWLVRRQVSDAEVADDFNRRIDGSHSFADSVH